VSMESAAEPNTRMVNDQPLSKVEIPKLETLVAIAEHDMVDTAESVMETTVIANMEFADIFEFGMSNRKQPWLKRTVAR
jgi:hypothetical protein